VARCPTWKFTNDSVANRAMLRNRIWSRLAGSATAKYTAGAHELLNGQNETRRPYAAVWCAAFRAVENGGIADRSSSSLFTNGGNYSQCQVGRSTWNVAYTCQRSIMLDPEVIQRRSAKHRGKVRGDFAPARDGASGALRLEEVTGNQAATTLSRRADRTFAPLDPPSFPMLPRSVFSFFLYCTLT
jgi:hypothetical protein